MGDGASFITAELCRQLISIGYYLTNCPLIVIIVAKISALDNRSYFYLKNTFNTARVVVKQTDILCDL